MLDVHTLVKTQASFHIGTMEQAQCNREIADVSVRLNSYIYVLISILMKVLHYSLLQAKNEFQFLLYSVVFTVFQTLDVSFPLEILGHNIVMM